MTRDDPRWLAWIGWIGFLAWGGFLVADTALSIHDPDYRSVIGIYERATFDWWKGRNIWGTGFDGFQYLPAFAVLFTPFALAGPQAGHIAWHVASLGLLFAGLWQVYRRLIDAPMLRQMGVLLLVALPAAAGSVRNGQATVAMFGCMLLATAALADRRWIVAGLWLGLAVAIKPLAIVMVLLMAVVYPETAFGLMLGIFAAFALPFLNPDPQAVVVLYGDMIEKLSVTLFPPAERFASFTGLLAVLGIGISDMAANLVRIAMAGAALILALRARRTLVPIDAAFGLLTVASAYLMLFSPRTESNTYVMLVFPIALYATQLWRNEARRGAAWLLIGLCFGLGAQAYGTLIFRATEIWLQPLLCAIFVMAFLVPRLVRRTRAPLRAMENP